MTYQETTRDPFAVLMVSIAVCHPIFGALLWLALGSGSPWDGLFTYGIAAYWVVMRGLQVRVELADGVLTVRRDLLLGSRWALRDVERARSWSVRGPNRAERWRLADMRAVELTLRGGRTVRVGSPEPGRLLDAIREAAPHVAVDPAVETGPESGPLHEPAYRRWLFVMEASAVGSLLSAAVMVAWMELT